MSRGEEQSVGQDLTKRAASSEYIRTSEVQAIQPKRVKVNLKFKTKASTFIKNIVSIIKIESC